MMPFSAVDGNPTDVTLLAHALAYARMGWEVLPCRPREMIVGGERRGAKAPYVWHGKDDATVREGVIESWWRRWPDALIGVRPAEGLVVVDVDPRNGGHWSLRSLLDKHGPLPETATARTGGGGLHIWLRCERVSVGLLCKGVDVKTRRGYVIVPPSPHPSGGTYQWTHAAPIAWAPGWLRLLLDPPPRPNPVPRTGGDGSGLVRFVTALEPGERNKGLYWAARQAAEAGTLESLSSQLVAAAIGVGLPEHEAMAVVRSAARGIGGAA